MVMFGEKIWQEDWERARLKKGNLCSKMYWVGPKLCSDFSQDLMEKNPHEVFGQCNIKQFTDLESQWSILLCYFS